MPKASRLIPPVCDTLVLKLAKNEEGVTNKTFHYYINILFYRKKSYQV